MPIDFQPNPNGGKPCQIALNGANFAAWENVAFCTSPWVMVTDGMIMYPMLAASSGAGLVVPFPSPGRPPRYGQAELVAGALNQSPGLGK